MRAAALVTLLLLVGASPAGAAKRVEIDYRVAGSIVATWHGAPDRCASMGVCGVRGTLTHRPHLRGEVAFEGMGTSTSEQGSRLGGVVARVERTGPDGSRHLCLDSVPATITSFSIEREGDRIDLRLGGQFVPEPTVYSGGRCAGPLSEDLGAVLPSATTRLRELIGRTRTVDLSQRTPFTAGPYDGELVSTVRARLTTRQRRVRERRPPRTRSGLPPEFRFVRQENLQLRYSIERIEGGLGFDFAGREAPVCELFDACGATGRIGVGLEGEGSLTLFGSRRLPRGRPRSLSRALRNLGDYRVDSFGQLDGEAPMLVSAAFAWPGEPTCAEERRSRSPSLALRSASGGVAVTLGDTEPPGRDVLRTRCPGPASDDLGEVLARGFLTTSQLRERAPQLVLRATGGFTGSGYTGVRGGEIVLTLRRTRASVEIGRGITPR